MITYLEDSNSYQSYDGTRWVGLVPQSPNAIINGAFEINQRNFTSTTTYGAFGFDRWVLSGFDGTSTYSSQAFTLGSAPVSGYEAANFARIISTGQTLTTASSLLRQAIEDVRTFAGQTVTVSFFAKAATGTPSISVELNQVFGTGGTPSPGVATLAGKVALSTSWQRYSVTATVPSISGKTLGTDRNSSQLQLNLFVSAGSNFDARTGSLGIQSNTFDIWGVQLEAGPVATPFRRNANSLQGELAACQRYYFRPLSSQLSANYGFGLGNSTQQTFFQIKLPSMRVTPTSVEFSNLEASDSVASGAVNSLSINSGNSTPEMALLIAVHSPGTITVHRPYLLRNNASTSGLLALSAEL
jgi:hypothetical protein